MVLSRIAVATFGAQVVDFFRFHFFIEFRPHFFNDFGTLLGAKMAPKTDLGGAWGQKGRPSISNNSPMKIQLFCLGRCPGTQKIVTGIASKFSCDFISILTPKMGPLGLPFGAFFLSKTVIGFGPGHFFGGCSPQSLTKPPKAARRTSLGSPRDPPGAPQGPPREPQ